jgi:hypothetical protein
VISRHPNSEDLVSEKVSRILTSRLPKPTVQFKRRAWLDFQRALDPLAAPRPLRPPRREAS